VSPRAAGSDAFPRYSEHLTGLAVILNVPAGPVTVTVTVAATGVQVSQVSFNVDDGGIDQVFALPTPQ